MNTNDRAKSLKSQSLRSSQHLLPGFVDLRSRTCGALQIPDPRNRQGRQGSRSSLTQSPSLSLLLSLPSMYVTCIRLALIISHSSPALPTLISSIAHPSFVWIVIHSHFHYNYTTLSPLYRSLTNYHPPPLTLPFNASFAASPSPSFTGHPPLTHSLARSCCHQRRTPITAYPYQPRCLVIPTLPNRTLVCFTGFADISRTSRASLPSDLWGSECQ